MNRSPIFLFFALLLLTNPCNAESPTELSPASIKKLLEPWASKFEATRREVVLVSLRVGEDSRWTSKIGGTPYLRRGEMLPKSAKQQPLHLLVQINFSEVPPIKGFPEKGLLQIFIAADEYYGANFYDKLSEEILAEQKNFRVVFHQEVITDAAKLEPLKLFTAVQSLPFNPSKSLRMKFTKTTETISVDDATFETKIGISYGDLLETLAAKHSIDEEELEEALTEYLEPHAFAHKLGGYPSFTQSDPRNADSTKQLLLQIASEDDDSLGLLWGDLGVAGFFIEPQALMDRSFSSVVYHWDCY